MCVCGEVTDQGMTALNCGSLLNVVSCGTEVKDQGITAFNCDALSDAASGSTDVSD